MVPGRVSNPGPLTYESGALPIALRGPATIIETKIFVSLNVVAIRNYRALVLFASPD